jgi:hypothetical protein
LLMLSMVKTSLIPSPLGDTAVWTAISLLDVFVNAFVANARSVGLSPDDVL